MRSHTANVWIDLGEGWRDWPEGHAWYVAHFDYSPGRPGVHTLRNGDPGYPDDPAELILNELTRNSVTLSIWNEDGSQLITDAQLEKIEQQCYEDIDIAQAQADEAEADSIRRSEKEYE
jgi:hypothetical protein